MSVSNAVLSKCVAVEFSFLINADDVMSYSDIPISLCVMCLESCTIGVCVYSAVSIGVFAVSALLINVCIAVLPVPIKCNAVHVCCS